MDTQKALRGGESVVSRCPVFDAGEVVEVTALGLPTRRVTLGALLTVLCAGMDMDAQRVLLRDLDACGRSQVRLDSKAVAIVRRLQKREG